MPLSEALRAAKICEAIRTLPVGNVNLMEVCGTHTMAIAKSGIKSMLPENIKLLSGPGCPVCVTPPELIDAVLELAMRPDIIIASYGDMLRVPGSIRGDSLQRRRALGAKVEIVYSPIAAIDLAKKNPDKQVVFLGVGFETTAPGTAAAVITAKDEGVKNFSVFSMLKTVEPALRALINMEGFDVQGFLCPGHVGTIIGREGFDFLPKEYAIPAVISGFEAEDILLSIFMLLRQIADKSPRAENAPSRAENAPYLAENAAHCTKSGYPRAENEYTRAVAEKGNELAKNVIRSTFDLVGHIWRGLGHIPNSGLSLKEEYSDFDACRRFGVEYKQPEKITPCRCGEVITGRLEPRLCPLFGKACTPEDPVGPCMVSSEGACAAAYKYQVI